MNFGLDIFTLNNIFSWLFLGLIAGSIANLLDPHPSRGGVIGSLILGIMGAMIGGTLSSLLLGVPYPGGLSLETMMVAILGSLLLLLVSKYLFSNQGQFKTTITRKDQDATS